MAPQGRAARAGGPRGTSAMLRSVTAADGLAIRLRGVVKRYGDITAVNGLDLDVPEGRCVGLLGPNGAGKSTTMQVLTAQSIADEGEVEVLGYVLPARSKAARARDGRRAAARQPRHDADRRAEPRRVHATSTACRARERQEAIERVLDIANLTDRRDAKVDELSGGMRRRLLIGRALIHRPRLRAARRADRRPRPAGPPGAVGADRPPAQRRHVDPDVDALHRGGRAPLRHRHDHVARRGRRESARRAI